MSGEWQVMHQKGDNVYTLQGVKIPGKYATLTKKKIIKSYK
jgi:hypothetical protein